jgi:UDP:flavonoid glycosyltransferase YjiC (YdhE family)
VRVLVTSTPGTGHVFPVLPLANELRRAGHQVLWVVAGEGVQLVRRHGFDIAVAGMNVAERRATLQSQLPEIMNCPPRLRRGQLFAGFFARGAAPKTVQELGPIFDEFSPDVVVHEIGELGAAPHAVARSIPHATVAFSGGLPDHAIPLLEDALRPVWAVLGLPPPSLSDIAGDVYFHPFPASMGQAAPLGQVRPMRPTDGAADDDEPPDWIASFGRERPAVYVTAGTTPVVATMAPWRPTFEALASIDVDVLATIGQLPVEELGPVPANVRIERFVPQGQVLSRAAAVVSHAGAGTMLAAAREGIPQLAIPTWADQWENADAIARTGAGVVLEETERDTVSIRDAVNRLLHDHAYIEAGSRLATEIAAMPSPRHHVATLEELVSA